MAQRDDIAKIYMLEKPKMLQYALKNITKRYGITEIDVECVVDELLVKVLKKDRDLNDNNHIHLYLWGCLKNELRYMYHRAKIADAPGLTTDERLQNFALAKQIIDYARGNRDENMLNK